MKTWLTVAVLITAVAAAWGQAQEDAGRIERHDPAVDAILGPNARLELLAGHLGMTEGPLWIDDAAGGHLLVSDIPANAIYRWTPDGELSVYMEEAGYTGDDILNVAALRNVPKK